MTYVDCVAVPAEMPALEMLLLAYALGMRIGMVLAVALPLCAQSPPDPTEVLARARDKLAERRQQLPNYTCVQTVDRSYLRRSVQIQPAPSCAQMSDRGTNNTHALQVYLTDRLHLDIKVSRGVEIGSWAGASQFDSRSIFELIGNGPYGTGALGPFLSDIFAEGSASFEYAGEKPAGGARLYEYSYRVPLISSHYSVEVAHDWRPLAYDGLVRIDPQSFDLRYLLARVGEFPPEAETCEAVTSVDYENVQMGTRNFLLPQQSRLHILMSDTTESDIAIKYTACREYHGEATIHFGSEQAAATTQQRTDPSAPVTLPPDLPISLSLRSPIDTDTAAAGDVVIENVRKSVRRSGEVLIPEGTTVRGRIIRMRHWLDWNSRFEISIRLETWEAGGTSRPIHAKPARESLNAVSGKHGRIPIILPPVGEPPTVATFVFIATGDRYVVPRGFASNWITVAAPLTP